MRFCVFISYEALTTYHIDVVNFVGVISVIANHLSNHECIHKVISLRNICKISAFHHSFRLWSYQPLFRLPSFSHREEGSEELKVKAKRLT